MMQEQSRGRSLESRVKKYVIARSEATKQSMEKVTEIAPAKDAGYRIKTVIPAEAGI